LTLGPIFLELWAGLPYAGQVFCFQITRTAFEDPAAFRHATIGAQQKVNMVRTRQSRLAPVKIPVVTRLMQTPPGFLRRD